MTPDALDSDRPFSKSALWVVIGVAVVSLATAIVLTVISRDPAEDSTSATSDAYSVSAIGHKGLVELLGKLDTPVVVTQLGGGMKASEGLLVIAEPRSRSVPDLRRKIAGAQRVLVVLPKWYGLRTADSPWIDSAHLVSVDEVNDVLAALGVTSRIARDRPPARWTTDEGFHSPTTAVAQYLEVPGDADFTSDVFDATHTLLGHSTVDGIEVWILADPDVINNAGLRHPENAQFAVSLIDRLRGDGPVVIDESIHGQRHAEQPGLLHVLFAFPVVLATLQIMICALLVIWAALVRFGPRRATPAPIAPGKDFLIRNTAGLLGFGGHHVEALRRYLAVNITAVTRALHAPEGLSSTATTAWLERMRGVRAVTISLPGLQADVAAGGSPQRLLELADQIYRWRSEMIHGPRKYS